MEASERPFGTPTWAIVEMMGHVVVAGEVVDETLFGKSMIRIDHPETLNRQAFTQYISPDALYRVTPTTELIARKISESNEPRPADLYRLDLQLKKYQAQMALESDDGELEYEDDEEYQEGPRYEQKAPFSKKIDWTV
jgi:hypothetical protein